MVNFRVRVKLVLLLMLALSILGLNKSKACDLQHCVELHNSNGQIMGYGCAEGGGFIECIARVQGCTIIYCAE